MKRLLAFLLLAVAALVCTGNRVANKTAGGGGSESLWIDQSSGAGVQAIVSPGEQLVHLVGTKNITKIRVKMDENQASSQAKVQIWQSGSQVGSDSNTVTYTGSGFQDYVFSGVSITGNFSFKVVEVSGQAYYLYDGSDPYETGGSYDVVGNSGRDMVFQIFTTP